MLWHEAAENSMVSWIVSTFLWIKQQGSSLETFCCLWERVFTVVNFHGWAILEDAWQQVTRINDLNKDRRLWNENCSPIGLHKYFTLSDKTTSDNKPSIERSPVLGK